MLAAVLLLTPSYALAQTNEASGYSKARQGKSNAQPDEPGAQLLKQAMARLSLSARAYHRILKVARRMWRKPSITGAD